MAEAAAWYDDRVAGLGERFLLEAEAAFARIDRLRPASRWSRRRRGAVRGTVGDAEVLPLDDEAARLAGRINADLERLGLVIALA